MKTLMEGQGHSDGNCFVLEHCMLETLLLTELSIMVTN